MTNINLTAERHIQSLSNNGARIRRPDGTAEPVSMDVLQKQTMSSRRRARSPLLAFSVPAAAG